MSDYLWDRSGEKDAEVERLETLLGAFAHVPRELELPAAEAPAAPRPRRFFAPFALAAAAALLLASLFIASAFLRARVSNGDGRAASRESQRSPEVSHKASSPAAAPAPRVAESRGEPGASKEEGAASVFKDERAAVESPGRVPRRRKGAQLPAAAQVRAAQVRRPRTPPGREAVGGGGVTLEALSAGGGASALVDSTRLVTKEQLVYALRLTGAKLRDVRLKTQGLERHP